MVGGKIMEEKIRWKDSAREARNYGFVYFRFVLCYLQHSQRKVQSVSCKTQ